MDEMKLEIRLEHIENALQRLGLADCQCGEWYPKKEMLHWPDTGHFCVDCLDNNPSPYRVDCIVKVAQKDPSDIRHVAAIRFLMRRGEKHRMTFLRNIYYNLAEDAGKPLGWILKPEFMPLYNRWIMR